MAMTEEERLLRALQNVRNRNAGFPQVNQPPSGGPQSPAMMGGTVNPYVRQDAAIDTDTRPREARYAQMMRQGGDLINTPAPQMKQLRGGRVAVAPTWSENAAGAAKKLLGGYMQRQARQGQAGIDERMADQAAAQGLVDQENARIAADATALQDQRNVGADARADETLAQNARRISNQEGQFGQTLEQNALKNKAQEGQFGQTLELNREKAAETARSNKAKEEANLRKIEADIAADKAEAASGGKKGKRTEAQSTGELRAKNLGMALDGMEKLITDGYNPTGFEAAKDKATGMTAYTNFLTSKEGQQWNSWAKQAKEQALRAATGAAAPDKENIEYMSVLIPAIGDNQETQDMKMKRLRQMEVHMREAASMPEGEEKAAYWNEGVEKLKAEDAQERDKNGGFMVGDERNGWRLLRYPSSDQKNWEKVE